jgi:hypothetical protein
MKQRNPGGVALGFRYGVIVLLTGALAVMASCYPGEITDVSELDTVATLYDNTYNFSANSTYWMPDSVYHLCEVLPEEDRPDDCIELSRAFDDEMIGLVQTNMQNLGYTLVADSTLAHDVRLVLLAVGTQKYSYYTYYPGWNPWYPGWGWYYPPSWGAVSYQTGTIFLPMVPTGQTQQVGDETGVPVVWSAAVNGVLNPSAGSSVTSQRLADLFNQAFAQSQYLKSGGGS